MQGKKTLAMTTCKPVAQQNYHPNSLRSITLSAVSLWRKHTEKAHTPCPHTPLTQTLKYAIKETWADVKDQNILPCRFSWTPKRGFSNKGRARTRTIFGVPCKKVQTNTGCQLGTRRAENQEAQQMRTCFPLQSTVGMI